MRAVPSLEAVTMRAPSRLNAALSTACVWPLSGSPVGFPDAASQICAVLSKDVVTMRFPSEETVETLYLLGEQDGIVGVSGYAVRPPQVRREKPRVSAFTSADIPKILALEPDLVLTFSDPQAEIAAELIRSGVAVHASNQRDIAGILTMIRTLGALVGAADKAERLATDYEARLAGARASTRGRRRPKVYFEEWDDPLISAIGWVSELIEIASGDDVFAGLRSRKSARERIVCAGGCGCGRS